MFMKTIAVGPLVPVASCVTGGETTVALPLLQCRKTEVAGDGGDEEVEVVARPQARARGVRNAIVRKMRM